MSTQTIDLNKAKSITFNGKEVVKVVLDGIVIWLKQDEKIFVRRGDA